MQLENAIYSNFYLINFEYHEFFTDLPLTELAILRSLRKFEGCLEVEGCLKTCNKSHYFRAWLSLKFLSTFLVVLLIRDTAERLLIKVVTARKLLISAAKMTQLWLGIVQHLARWPPFFISLLQSVCLREHLYKILRKINLIFLPRPRYLKKTWRYIEIGSFLGRKQWMDFERKKYQND